MQDSPSRLLRTLILSLGCLLLTACLSQTVSTNLAPVERAQTAHASSTSITRTIVPIKSQTFTPTSTPTRTPSVTPTTISIDEFCSPDPGIYAAVEWAVPASPPRTQRLEWLHRDEYFRSAYLYWNDDNTLTLERDCGDAFVRLDPSTANVLQVATLTPTPGRPPVFSPPEKVFSPNRTYYIDCGENQSDFYRTEDQKIIISVPEQVCVHPAFPEDGSWANDESRYVYVRAGGGNQVVLLSMDGDTPKELVYAYAVRWSPDSKRLLTFGIHNDWSQESPINLITIFNRNGIQESQIKVPGKTHEYNVLWYTNLVIQFNSNNWQFGSYQRFYDWASGTSLGEGWDNYYLPLFSQGIKLSPDQNWQVSDVSDRELEGTDQPIYHYTLADFRKKEITDLSVGTNQQLQLLGWSPDSTIFYLVNRPARESVITPVEMPFGLLALDVASRSYLPLFERAFFVKFSPDQQRAWILFPARRPDGSVGLDGAVFDLRSKDLSERYQITAKILYQNPAEGDLMPVAWSNSGSRLAFMTDEREVFLHAPNGGKTLLGRLPSSVPPDMSQLPPDWHRLLWSPDDQYLVVQSATWFWVLDVGAIGE